MGLKFDTHPKSSYLGRFDKDNPTDMAELAIVKKMVGFFNRDSGNVHCQAWQNRTYKWRIERKPRQVYKKGISPKTGKPITYIPNAYGAVFGGMANTRIFDAYIYRRYN